MSNEPRPLRFGALKRERIAVIANDITKQRAGEITFSVGRGY